MFYLIGCVIAFLYCNFDALAKIKNKEDISDYPLMMPFVTLTSWLYISLVVYSFLYNCKKYLKS